MEINKLTYKKNQTEIYLDNVIKNNKLSHAYLFVNSSKEILNNYIFKFVKAIFCEKNKTKGYYSCEKCKKCLQINNNNYIDFYIINLENSIKKEDVLFIKKEMQLKSTYNKKIYWLKDVDKLTIQAANSILKILEEPEEDIIAIMSTTNKNSVLDTIISRCQVINIKENFISNIKDEYENYSKIYKVLELFLKEYEINKNIALINILNQITSKEDILIFFNILKEKFKNADFKYEKKITNYYFVYNSIMESLENLDLNVSSQLVLESFFIKIILNNISLDFIEDMLKDINK